MSTVAHGSYIILNICLLEKMGNSKINGGSKSGVLTTFELLNEHAEKSNRETRLCLGKIANCRQILKPFWMSMAVLWRWEHPGVVGGRATAVLAAAPLPNKGEPSRWGVCTPIAWEIPAGGGMSTAGQGCSPWVQQWEQPVCVSLCLYRSSTAVPKEFPETVMPVTAFFLQQ